jgi:hypothetical protein
MKLVVTWVSKSSMPQLSRVRRQEVVVAIICGAMQVVEITGWITLEQSYPRSEILYGKAKRVKSARNPIITSKSSNRNQVFNQMRGNENIVQGEKCNTPCL